MRISTLNRLLLAIPMASVLAQTTDLRDGDAGLIEQNLLGVAKAVAIELHLDLGAALAAIGGRTVELRRRGPQRATRANCPRSRKAAVSWRAQRLVEYRVFIRQPRKNR